MKKIMIRTFIIFLISNLMNLNSKAQATIRHKIINGQTTIPYLQTQNGATTIAQNIELTIEYFGASLTVPDSITFIVANLTDTTLHAVINNPLQVIPKDSFIIDRKQIKFTLAIATNAIPNLASPASFDIKINGTSDTTHSIHHVVINNVAINQPAATVETVRITHLYPDGDTAYLPPFIKDKEAKTGRQFKIRYLVSGKLSRDSVITLVLETPSGTSIKPVLVTKNFIIHKDKTPTKGRYDSVYINFDISAQKDFGEDEDLYLSFENGDAARDVLRFTRRGLINPNKPFWIEIGANLDLIDGIQPNNLFTGVFFYKRDLQKFYKYKRKQSCTKKRGDKQPEMNKDAQQKSKDTLQEPKSNNISIFAGIYESKTSSDSSSGKTTDDFRYFDRNAVNLIRNDSFPIFKDSGSLRFKTVTKVISLFISPSIRLTNRSANEDGLHIFMSLWFEMLWLRKNVIADASGLVRKDTIFIPKNQVRPYPGSAVIKNSYFDYRSQYFGIGFPIYMKDNDVNLFVNPVVGWTNQRDIAAVQTISGSLDQQLYILPKHNWNLFYITQFRLSEEKYGFAFTGEVRGLFLKNSKPQISLALSKKFDLNKFLEFK